MHKIPLAAAAKKIKQIKAGLLHPLNLSTPGRPIKNPTLNTPRVSLPRMLCTVARAALPREYAEVFPLPPSVRTKPLHQEFFSLFPSLYPGQKFLQAASSPHTSSEGEVAVAVPPLPVLTSRAGAGAGGVRPGWEQGWQPALLCLAHRREKLPGFGALLQESCRLQPPRRQEP